jgi:hypothetical protein
MTTPKLTESRNEIRKEMRNLLPKGSSMAYSEDVGFTLLLVPDGSVTRMFTAVASLTETKFRRKVGEYLVLDRWATFEDGYLQGVVLPGTEWNAGYMLDRMEMVPSWVWDNLPEDSMYSPAYDSVI